MAGNGPGGVNDYLGRSFLPRRAFTFAEGFNAQIGDWLTVPPPFGAHPRTGWCLPDGADRAVPCTRRNELRMPAGPSS